MDSSIATTIVTGIVSLLGGGAIGAAGKVWIDSRKLQGDQCLAEDAQVMNHYGELVGRLETRISTLEKQHQNCVDDHLKVTRELGRLEGALSEQRLAMQQLQASTARAVGDDPVRPVGIGQA